MKGLERRAPLGKRRFDQRPTLDLQAIEQHQLRRRLRGKLAHPAFGRVQPQLQRLERQHAADRDDQLAVEHEPVAGSAAMRRDDLREIAPERPPRLGLQLHVLAVAEDEAAKAVPFGLELPALALGQRLDQLRLHRRQGRRRLQVAKSGPKASPNPSSSPDARHSPQFRHASSAGVKPA